MYAAVRNLDSAKPLLDQYGDRVEALHIDLEKPETITNAAQHAADVQGGGKQCRCTQSVHTYGDKCAGCIEL